MKRLWQDLICLLVVYVIAGIAFAQPFIIAQNNKAQASTLSMGDDDVNLAVITCRLSLQFLHSLVKEFKV